MITALNSARRVISIPRSGRRWRKSYQPAKLYTRLYTIASSTREGTAQGLRPGQSTQWICHSRLAANSARMKARAQVYPASRG